MEANASASIARPTLGVFISRLRSYYESIWNGIAQAATESNANVLCFIGGEINSQIGSQRHWNVIYDLAGPDNVDGLIVSAALQNYVTTEEMAQFCARYAPLPMISIGSKLENIPSITIDNDVGLRELMRHLIDDHQYKRIAFIRGPKCNPEADVRYQTFIEALKEHGLPFDPNLVLPGDFTSDTGADAIRLLLDRRRLKPEAVVASDDIMAVGAYQELTKRGFNVPSDIAVTGFDDTSEARIIATPLTTIHQPLVEQGRQAVRMLLKYIREGMPPVDLTLETKLVIRESCGCSPLVSCVPHPISSDVSITISNSTLFDPRDAVLAEIQETLCPYYGNITLETVKELVDAFFAEIEGQPAVRFMPLFSHLLRVSTMNTSRTDLDAGIISKWQDVLSILRRKALPYKRPEIAADIDALLHQGYTLITQIAERAHSNLRVQAEESIFVQSEIVRDINAASDTRQIADVLAQSLPRMGIRTCALALYEEKNIPPRLSRLIMVCYGGERLGLEPGGRFFPSRQLIPPDVLPSGKLPFLGVRPLVLRDTHIGFVVMEMLAGHRTMCDTYEELTGQISSALYKVLLLQQIRQSNQDLQQRAAEMVEANIQLEQFAYIASHDLQEPLRMVASYLGLLEKRYQDSLDADAREFIGYAIDGAQRMKQMIDDLLAYSRVATSGQPFEVTDCEQLLAQALSNLKIAIKEADALITHDPLPSLMADGTQLVSVFQNLIGNALKFRADRQPQIHISAEQRAGEWVFSVRDNGIGIEPEYAERIFVIFSRLHTQAEYPGTGIGLVICRKVLERHGGRIWIESQLGEGATFFFTIPAHSSSGISSRLT